MIDAELVSCLRRLVRAEVDAALAERATASERLLLTVKQYASTNSIGVSTVRRAITEGRLDVERIGRSIRIPVGARIMAPSSGPEPLARAEQRLGLAAVGSRGRR